MHTPAALLRAQQLGLAVGRPNQDVFAEILLARAKEDPNILVVTSDSRGSAKLVTFGASLPRQLIEVGIAEQNLVGIAAGLSSCNKTVFAVSPACFMTARALEQVKNDVAYSDNPVKLIGISAGVSYGALGSTHHSLHDLAALRAINNIDILVPADDQETHAAVDAAIDSKRPAYLRFGKVPLYALGGAPYETGRARLVRDGVDLAFVANGETVIHALLAAAELAATEGLSCRVLSMHTIRPIDEAAILRAAAECGAIITVEEHMAHGGLGEACAAILMQSGSAIKFKIVAIPDEATITGSQADIFHHYGISMEGLALTAKRLLHGGPASRDP